MMRQLKILAMVFLCYTAALPVQASDCFLPQPPSKLPDGRTASEQEMQLALQTVQQYNSDVMTYLKCLDFEVKQNQLSSHEEARLHNDAVETLQRVADKFNEQVRTFKARSG
jgi:hypothetical protein